jgi:hypothetical protein
MLPSKMISPMSAALEKLEGVDSVSWDFHWFHIFGRSSAALPHLSILLLQIFVARVMR